MEVLADIINDEWNSVNIMYAEPWGITWVVPPNERDDYEMHFIEQGRGRISIADRVYDMKPGDLVILNSQEGNSFRADTESFRFLYVTFSFDKSKQYIKIKKLNKLLQEEQSPLHISDATDFRRILYTMHREITVKPVAYSLRIKLLLGSLIMEIMDKCNYGTCLKDIGHVISSDSYKQINKAIVFLQDNYNKDTSLEIVGKFVNLHPRYLCTLFRQITGKTIGDFVRQLRIEKAKRLLLYTSLSITEIAYEVGYSSSQYFSKIFGREEKMEPRVFRKTRKNI